MRGILFAALLAAPFVMEITAYTWTGNRTASGVWPVYGMAACPRQLAFGTRLHVEGVGVVTCTDRGGAIRGNRLDLFLPTRAQAVRWGRRTLHVRRISPQDRRSGPNEPRKGIGAPSEVQGVRGRFFGGRTDKVSIPVDAGS